MSPVKIGVCDWIEIVIEEGYVFKMIFVKVGNFEWKGAVG